MIIIHEHEISQVDGRCIDCGRNIAQCKGHHVCSNEDLIPVSVSAAQLTLEPVTRNCCDCDAEFVPLTEHQRRCVPCQVADDFG